MKTGLCNSEQNDKVLQKHKPAVRGCWKLWLAIAMLAVLPVQAQNRKLVYRHIHQDLSYWGDMTRWSPMKIDASPEPSTLSAVLEAVPGELLSINPRCEHAVVEKKESRK